MNNHLPSSPDSQTLLNTVVLEFLREQKRKRLWRWFIRSVIFLFIVFFVIKFILSSHGDDFSKTAHVGLIDLNGAIFANQDANADYFAKGLANAYKKPGLKALILRINSPGGSPVQASYMYNRLQTYRKEYPEIKVYAVCVDLCASAAYYVASAADEIYANESSLVGSIGVIYNGFGFVDALQKLGISRRLETAGRSKGFLDPFSPVDTKQQQQLQSMLNDIHQQFINSVKKGRGARLIIDDDTFSGLFWTGIRAKERGLIDGFASSGQVANDILKLDKVIDYTYKESFIERMGKSLGTAFANQIPHALGLTSGVSL